MNATQTKTTPAGVDAAGGLSGDHLEKQRNKIKQELLDATAQKITVDGYKIGFENWKETRKGLLRAKGKEAVEILELLATLAADRILKEREKNVGCLER